MALLQACATSRPMPPCTIATLRSSSEASTVHCCRVAFAPLCSRGQPLLQTSRRVHVQPLAAAGYKLNSIQELNSSLETEAGDKLAAGEGEAAGHKLNSIQPPVGGGIFLVFKSLRKAREKTLSHQDYRQKASSSSTDLQLEILRGRAVETAAVSALLLSSRSALADEGVEAGGEVVEVVANSTISVLFVAATLGLVILTIGVIYLSIQDYLEKRQLESQAKAGQDKRAKKSLEVVKSARSGPKGFGSKRPSKDDNDV